MYQELGDTGILLYDFFNNLSVFVLIIFNLTQLQHKKLFLGNYSKQIMLRRIKKKRKNIFDKPIFWAIIETLIVSVFQFAPVLPLNKAFGDWVNTGTNYFGLCFLLPPILMLAFLVLTIPPLKQLDLITPAFALTLITIKFACFCAGCCKGFPCSFGLYNQKTEQLEFPVQLVESGLALLIFIFLIIYRKKAKEGTLFPIYLIAYSFTRFFSEFLRAAPNVLWIFKKYHFLCLAGVILGFVELFLVKKYKENINSFYSSFSEFLIQKLYLLAVKTGIIKVKVRHRKKKK